MGTLDTSGDEDKLRVMSEDDAKVYVFTVERGVATPKVVHDIENHEACIKAKLTDYVIEQVRDHEDVARINDREDWPT